MDPLSHAVAGRLLVGNRAARGAGVAAVLGALCPDIDAVLMPVGWDLYLRLHQVGTHTFVGMMACAVLVGTVVAVWARGTAWRTLAAAAWIGAFSHTVLDVVSGATIRPLWPLSDSTMRFGLVAMAEPALVAIFVAAAVVWWLWPARRTNAALTSLALVFIILVGKAAVRREAQRLYDSATRQDAVRASTIEAEWGTTSGWIVMDRTDDRVRRWHVDTTRSTVVRELDRPLPAETAAIEASQLASVVRNLLAAHEFPIAVETDDAGGSEVRWSDAQYCRTSADGLACDLWFGVVFDATHTLTRQFVTIGAWTQERR